MSNRKKTRDQATNKRNRGKSWFKRGIDARHEAMTHDEMIANPAYDQYGVLNVHAPKEDDVEVIKEVPAMHTGLPNGEHAGEVVEVGTAILHSDRSVSIRYHEDAPLWALEEIQAYADKIGYSLNTGGFTDGTA